MEKNIVTIFEEQVKKFPFSIAVIEGNTSITYRDLNKSANQLANYLISRGVKTETIVTLLADRSISLVVGMLAVLKARGIYCPIDPSYPLERIKYVLQDTHSPIVLTQTKYLERLPSDDNIVVCLDDLPPTIALNSVSNPALPIEPTSTAYIMYTSGTTGLPKGVMIEQRSIVNLVLNQNFVKLFPDYSMMHISNISFDISTFEIWASLLNSCQLIVIDDNTAKDLAEFSKIIKQNPNPCVITSTNLFESMIDFKPDFFKGCKFVIFGGENCNIEKIKKYIEKTGKENLPDQLFNAYGPTEATTLVTFYEIKKGEDHDIIPIGKPIANIEIEILDQSMNAVPKGELGEIYISGLGVAKGYLNRTSLTQEKFIEINNKKMYRSGDLGKILPDGNLEFHGRLDNQIKIKGYRVELEEIESTLWAMPDVENAVVKLNYNAEGKKSLIAYLTIHKHLIRVIYGNYSEIKWQDGTTQLLEVADLSQGGICLTNVKKKCKQQERVTVKLPSLDSAVSMQGEVVWQSGSLVGINFAESYEMINKYIDSYYQRKCAIIPQRRDFKILLDKILPSYMIPDNIFVLSTLPLTPNGKIDRNALDKIDLTEKEENVVKTTESEEILMQLWREVLSISKISPSDDFFSLGGDSLLVTKVIAKLRDQYNVNIGYDQFFSNPSLSQLSAFIGNQIEKSHFNPIPALSNQLKTDLSISQKRIWFLSRIFPNLPLFNLTKSVIFEKEIYVEEFKEAIEKLIKRQEILKTCFSLNEKGEPFRRLSETGEIPLTISNELLNLAQYSEGIKRHIKDQNSHVFNLSLPSMFKILVLPISNKETILILTFHRIISDEISVEIFLKELFELYSSILEGREDTLLPLPIQYSDFSVWQTNQLSLKSDEYKKLIQFWKNHLLGAPIQLDLPYDKVRKNDQTFKVKNYNFVLNEKIIVSLHELSKNLGTTLNMVLYATFLCLLFVITGKRDIVLGMLIANRNRAENENLIGPYENILPIRVSFSPLNVVEEFLDEVKFILLNCYQNQDLRFEKTLEFFQDSPNLKQHPLFQVLFSFRKKINTGHQLKKMNYKIVNAEHDYSFFDLMVKLEEDEKQISIAMQYSSELFNPETIENWAAIWKNIASIMPEHLKSTLQDLSRASLVLFDKKEMVSHETKTISHDEEEVAQTKVEKIIYKIWADVLKRYDFSITDSFFKIGGHSLLLIQIISKIKIETGTLIPVKVFFEQPTVKGLAHYIEGEPDTKKRMIQHLPYPEDIPLSYAQERLWFTDRLTPNNPVYNNPFVFKMSGKFSIEKLKNAIDNMVQRHEILRTEFKVNQEGHISQNILNKCPINIEITAETTIPSDKIIEKIVSQPFNLEKAPLFRVTVLKYSLEEFYLIICFHYIIMDDFSAQVFFNELSVFYTGLREKIELLPKQEIQYADYTLFRRQHLISGGHPILSGLRFWADYLNEAPETHECPLDYERPIVSHFQGKRLYFSFTTDISEKIKKISAHAAGSDFVVLLSAFFILINKISLQDDIVVANPVKGRNYSGAENLIGFFMNLIPFRIKVNSSVTVLDFIMAVKESVLKAFEYQYVPYEKILSTKSVKRAINCQPLTQLMFAFQKNIDPILEFPNLKIEKIPFEFSVSKFDLMMNIEEYDGAYKGYFEYDSQLFSDETIKKWKDRWLALLDSIVSNPQIPVFELNILSADEEQKVLVEWNDTKNDFDKKITFNELFHEQVLTNPQGVAVEFFNQTLSYSALNEIVEKLSYYLFNKCIKSNPVFGIICDRTTDLVVSILASMKVGAAFVILDSELPLERIHYMIAESKVDMLIIKKMYRSIVPHDFNLVVELETYYTEDELELKKYEISRKDDHLAYIAYTSGSTGRPKGVMIEEQALSNRLLWWKEAVPLNQEEVFLNLFPFDCDGAIAGLLWPLMCGATVLIPPQDIISNIESLINIMIKKNVTSIMGTPSVLNLILNGPRLKNSRLRKIIFAGENLTKSVLEKARRIANASIYNFYGPTECTIISTYAQILPLQQNITIGRPILNVKIYILDRYLRPVPIGMIGEIFIGGIGVSPGYISQPRLSELSFINNPFVLGEKLYRTGDLAVWRENGEIEYKGRIGNQIKINGYRVELEEIEYNLKAIEGVKNAVVTYENNKIIAFVVSDIAIPEVKNKLSRFLPFYSLPNKIIQVNEIPLTSSGKPNKKLIFEYLSFHDIVLPRTNTEKQLASVFQEMLKVENFSVTNSFFDLGGTSLLVTQAISKIQKATGYTLTIQEFYLYPTIEMLAKRIDNALVPELSYTHSILTLLEQDIHLGDAISLPSTVATEGAVFITGATGFLGRHLLKEILENTQTTVYYLVQDNDISRLKSDKLLSLYKGKRLYPIFGDLNKPDLGIPSNIYELLSENVSHIYHCAAAVHYFYTYQQVRQANVLGSVEILRLAAHQKLKKISFVSSLSSCFDFNEAGGVIEDFSKTYPTGSEGGYVISKWVSEKIYEAAINRGFDITIYRPTLLLESEAEGEFDFENNYLFLFVKGALQSGFAPAKFNQVDGMPVDFVAKLIFMIGFSQTPLYRIYNLNNPHPISTDTIFEWLNELGANIQLISYDKWKDEILPHLSKENPLYPLLSLYLGNRFRKGNDAKEGESLAEHRHTIEFMDLKSLQYPSLDIGHFSFFIKNIIDFRKKN